MIKINFSVFLFLYVMTFFSCAGNRSGAFIPIPSDEYFKREKSNIEIDSITETMSGNSYNVLPAWLAVYIVNGIEEVEKINSYNGKYAFVGGSRGLSLAAMNMWADNYSTAHDFSMLAAKRIERRMIYGAALYPDNEYGLFFQTMVKKAYSTLYPGAIKEDIYWIKIKTNSESYTADIEFTDTALETYYFFVLITIDKIIMQDIIKNIMAEAFVSVTPTSSQRNAIIRLRQNFFEGF